MGAFAVVQSGGKQYIVKRDDELIVDHLSTEENKTVAFDTLALFDSEKKTLQLGKPFLKNRTEAKVLTHLRGKKIRVARFKAKVRYRKLKGFRPALSKVKILTI